MIKIVALEQCTGCEACVNNCPGGVLKVENGKVKIVDRDMCTGCQMCQAVCLYTVIVEED